MINRIKPKVVKFQPTRTTQCCVNVDPPVHDDMWRRDAYKKLHPSFDPDKCQRESTVVIDGKPYCRIHADAEALSRRLNGKLAEAK